MVKVITRNYSERYTDGETDWLLGNVGDWQKLKLRVEVAVEFLSSQQNPVEIDRVNNAFVLSSGTWGEKGFDNGMTTIVSYRTHEDTDGDGQTDLTTNSIEVYTITNISGNVMEVEEEIGFGDFDNVPINYGIKKIDNVLFYVENDPEGLQITYGHLTNDDAESENLNSLIDGSKTKFSFSNLNGIGFGEWNAMEAIGIQSGMSIRNGRIKKVINVEEGVATEFNVLESGILELSKVDSTETLNAVRSVKLNLSQSFLQFQNATSESVIPRDFFSGVIGSANSNQAFLYNIASDGIFQIWINQILRVTAISWPGDVSKVFKLSVLRFTGGASMNFAEETVVGAWTNFNSILNRDLNVNSIVEINATAGDSFVLALLLEDAEPGESDDYLKYKIQSGNILVSSESGSFNESYKKIYDIELDFMFSSFFEQFADLETFTIPSYLQNEGSLTDNFKLTFFPEWNNPNVSISNDMSRTIRLGNTGWFNENFNELENEFSVDSIIYTDEDGNVVESLDFASQTHVKIEISGVPNLNENSEFGIGFAWIPSDEEDFKEKETPFYKNCFVSSGNYDDGFTLGSVDSTLYPGAGIDGGNMGMKNVHFYEENGKLICECDLIPNASFFSIFNQKEENDRNYILWVSVADGELVRNFSDRVSLVADVNQLKKHLPVVGEYDQIENAFIEHPYNESYSGVEIYKGIVQDDLLCRLPLRIPLDGSKLFQNITFGVCVVNDATGQFLDLERVGIDLAQFPITNDGVHQINVDTIRGFKLESGNNKNFVKITRDENLDTVDFAGYLCLFATKLRWEDWLVNQDSLVDFFDSNELQNGLNNDWFHYFSTVGWSLKFFSEISSEENDELLVYRNYFDIIISDYDSNPNLIVEHRYLRDSDDTVLNIGTDPETNRPLGVVLTNEPVRVEILFTIQDSGTWDLSNTYGVMTLEIEGGAGRMQQRQLSSVWGSESDNPLKPLENETKLKLEVDGTNKILTMSALIDPELIDPANKYRITGRVGCSEEGTLFDSRLYEFRYEELYQ